MLLAGIGLGILSLFVFGGLTAASAVRRREAATEPVASGT